jgi:hypothetical protein
MSRGHAKEFTLMMRHDKEFRNSVRASKDHGGLQEIFKEKGLEFDIADLAAAMADCMDEQEACAVAV